MPSENALTGSPHATAPLVTPAGAPPRPIFRAVLALRNWLLRLADALVPGQVALIDRLGGVYQLEMVHAAAELGLADHLRDGPKTLAELARATGALEDPLGRLLRALVSYGLFARDASGRYANNSLSRALIDGAPGSLRSLARFVGSPYHLRGWDRFVASLRTGECAFQATHGVGLFDYYRAHPDDAAHFNGAMVGLTEMDAPALAAAYDFGAAGDGKVCDVAGGHGTLLAHILVRHPRLRGVLFDEEAVVAGAEPLLAAYGVEERTERVAGSLFEKVPEGCAIYVLKDILHDWDDERALAILKVVRAAMGDASRLLVAEMVVDREEDRYFGTLLDLEMLAVMGGRQRSAEQLDALFGRAGLRLTRVVRAASPTSLVEAVRLH